MTLEHKPRPGDDDAGGGAEPVASAPMSSGVVATRAPWVGLVNYQTLHPALPEEDAAKRETGFPNNVLTALTRELKSRGLTTAPLVLQHDRDQMQTTQGRQRYEQTIYELTLAVWDGVAWWTLKVVVLDTPTGAKGKYLGASTTIGWRGSTDAEPAKGALPSIVEATVTALIDTRFMGIGRPRPAKHREALDVTAPQVLNIRRHRLQEANQKLTATLARTEKAHAKALAKLAGELNTARATVESMRQARKRQQQRIDELVLAQSRAVADADAQRAECTSLQANVAALQAAAVERDAEIRALQQDLARRRAELEAWHAAATTAALQPPPTATEVEPTAQAVPPPTDFEDLDGWARAHLGDRVVLLPRAVAAARKDGYIDPPEVYRALLALANDYWPAKMHGDRDAHARWEAFLRENRYGWGPVGECATSHQFQDSYTVCWNNRRVVMDMHLQGRSARRESRCLRIYLHVDVEGQTLVVGHLPAHLRNRLT